MEQDSVTHAEEERNKSDHILTSDTLVNGSISPSAPASRQRMVSVKMALILVGIFIVAALLYYYRGMFIAATVDGSPISRFAVLHELEKASGKSMLDSLITEKLIERAAAKEHISVGADETGAEITRIEMQVSGQGNTLDAVLAAQGVTRDDLIKQITLRKMVEKLLGDKLAVNDADVDAYIADNNITLPKDDPEKTKEQIKEQLKAQKFSEAAGAYIEGLRSQANIQHYVSY